MDVYAIAAVAGLFLAGLLSPGPNVLVVASASATAGRRAGIAAGLGVVCGDVFYACLGLIGLSGAIVISESLFSAIKFAGGLYLVWLGVWMAFTARDGERDENGSPPVRTRSWFRRGLTTDLANPHTAVFFASVFAGTLGPATTIGTKIAVIGAVAVTSLFWRLVLAAFFSTPRLREAFERRRRAVGAAAGGILALTGLRIAARA